MRSFVGDEKTGREVTQPEWDTVEAERDYWKKLALAYAAKIAAIEHTMRKSWTVTLDATGKHWIEEARNEPSTASDSPGQAVGARLPEGRE